VKKLINILLNKFGREIINKIEALDYFLGFKTHIDYNKTTPQNLLQEKIESLSKCLHHDKGSLRILKIKDDSIRNANDLYGTARILNDLVPSQYIPDEYMLDQNQIYLYDYLMPQLQKYIYKGEITLDAEIYIEDKSISPFINEDYDLHMMNLKEKHKLVIEKTENYVSNLVFYFKHILKYEENSVTGNILSRYRTYISNPGSWRTKISTIKGMAVILERSFPGLGTSVVNWLIPKLTLKTGGTITFTELISKYCAQNEKWYNFNYRAKLSTILSQYTTFDATQAELLNQPPNLIGFFRLLNFISNVEKLILNTDLGNAHGTKRAVDTNRHLILAQCIGNLLGLSDSKISDLQSHFRLIVKGVALTTLDDSIMMEKLLTFCDEFFNIWIEENTNNFDETYYSPYISEAISGRLNFIISNKKITTKNLIFHWMDWSNSKIYDFKSTFGPDSLLIKGSTPYLTMYREDATPSGFSEYHWLHNNFNLRVKKFRRPQAGGTLSHSTPYLVKGDVILKQNDDYMSKKEVQVAKILARWISNEDFVSINSPGSPLRQLLVVKEIKFPGLDTIYSVRTRDSLADFAEWMFGSALRRSQLESILDVGDLTKLNNKLIAFEKIKEIFQDSTDPILSSLVTVNRRTYSFKNYYYNRVSNYKKVICYDFLVWLKENLGFGIEYEGMRNPIYRMRKEFDAKQLIRDRIPMIYICIDENERQELLNLKGVIGYKYPLLTINEFEIMTNAWFHAYSQSIDLTFQEFIKKIHEMINADIGSHIQKVFGYNQGQYLADSEIGNHFWIFFMNSESIHGLFYKEYQEWSKDYPNAV